MDPSLEFSDCAELVRITRNGMVESRHLGVAVVLDPSGQAVAELGNPQARIFPRSALKPFQAIGSLRAGAKLSPQGTALACASHLGTLRHQRIAGETLETAGLDAADLQCPSAWPGDGATRTSMILNRQHANRLAFNCSGKHAAFLNAAVLAGAPTSSYLSPEHPVQRAALAAMEEFCGPISFVGVDGCGAPAPQMSLLSLARGFRQLVLSRDVHAQQVVHSIRENPWAIRGEGSANTLVVERTGIIAKLGAEGVLAMGTPAGYSVALKMLDGSPRGTDLLALDLLASVGALGELDHRWLRQALTPEPPTPGARAAGLELAGRDFPGC
ncbi:asparaginase [Glutamicibacter protophormiae]|uniref:asparaginase n=1 Tax=Glutamicibacter protophormiae TaxID=37930 RepID=UPI002A83F5AA|nr:asparaginase [Glutamicibacter protophormiae]WPR63823.1 asparaginase [Glutamicibacter protophormiae]WPR67318.1 asparaginase [Glutamicibacter protophormiae]